MSDTVFDYGDGGLNEGLELGPSRAIIRQLVCGRYCYLMLMPLDPIDTRARDGTKNRFHAATKRRRRPPRRCEAPSPPDTGVVVHEEADSGMLRSGVRPGPVPTCPPCTTTEPRGAGRRGRGIVEGEEIALSRHRLLRPLYRETPSSPLLSEKLRYFGIVSSKLARVLSSYFPIFILYSVREIFSSLRNLNIRITIIRLLPLNLSAIRSFLETLDINN